MKKFKLAIVLLTSLLLSILCISLLGWWGLRLYRMTYIENNLVRPRESFPLKLKWQVDLGRSTYEYPAYHDGLILMPANNGFSSYWYGVNAITGQLVWSQSVKRYSFLRCLTDEYLVLSGPESFIVLKPQTGMLVWEKERASTASCNENVVFYSDVPRNSVQAANLLTGQRLWTGTEPWKSFDGIIYDPESNKIIAQNTNVPAGFSFIDPRTGVVKFSFDKEIYPPQDRNWRRGPMYLIDRGELFLGGTVLDTQTGQTIHEEDRYETVYPPNVTADTMYLSALYQGVIAFDRLTYEIKWFYPSPLRKFDSLPLRTLSPVKILHGTGYIIFSDATLRAFDLETGGELGYWQPDASDLRNWPVCTYPAPAFGCDETARAGLAISDHTLFVSFGDGKLYAFGE